MPTRKTRQPGDLEREILACLAASTTPMSVQQVVDELADGKAYTTILTTMTRLFEKDAVARERVGRAYLYSIPHGAEGAQAAMAANRMRRLIADRSDRRRVLAHFVSALDADDEQFLRDLLGGSSSASDDG